MADDSRVFCRTCNKFFSSNRYYMQHFKYKSNVKCKKAFQKIHENRATPQKRSLEDAVGASNNPLLQQHAYVMAAVGDICTGLGIQATSAEPQGIFAENSDNDGSFGVMLDDDLSKIPSYNLKRSELPPDAKKLGCDTSIRDEFREYTAKANKDFCELTADSKAGIALRGILQDARAPLNLYDKLYHWHTAHLSANKYLNQKQLVNYLSERYNMSKCKPKETKPLLLPHSKARVKLVVHSFKEQLGSLLTDCRVKDEDYLFFDNNPFQAPPDDWTHVSDINSGRAYRETYKQLIKDPSKEVLLPIIFYMDGAVTGQFDNLPIESLKFTLGIYNAKARARKYAWRELGYVTNFLVEDTQGRDEIRESAHMDATDFLGDEDDDNSVDEESLFEEENNPNKYIDLDLGEGGGEEEEEGEEEDEEDQQDTQGPVVDKVGDTAVKIKSCSGQDLHAMLDMFLETYREVEERGIAWDLRYNGKTYPVEFVPFVMFIKGDSQEQDKHCGSYTARTQAIKQLCRYCCCPNQDTDEPYKRYNLKTPTMIQELVDKKEVSGLQALSQQSLQNAWYKVRFGSHNTLGVHGATPLELLHWLQLGKYKYSRQMFFAQSGKKSKLTKNINKLAKLTGVYYARQSDRDLPRTNFSKGIISGKLMAGEMTGLILVLCTVLRCYRGRHMILTESRGKQKQFLGELAKIKDWIMLLETMLQMEAWLKESRLSVYSVERFEVKVRELMALEKQIGQREEGMGFKTFNFHGAIHISDDILNFGVPSNVNTDSNEMHHKPDKTAALRTQRRPKDFDKQLANQIHATAVVSEGMHEVKTNETKWMYLTREPAEKDDPPLAKAIETEESDEEEASTIIQLPGESDIRNTGVRCRFFYSEDTGKWEVTVRSRMKDKDKFKLGPELTNMLSTVANELAIEEIHLFTEHKRFDQIFRASPRYLGKAWRDWVLVDWGDALVLPGHLWIFVDLRNIPQDLVYEPGIYAVLESSNPVNTQAEVNLSQIFRPYVKETGAMKNGSRERKFYLVNVDSFYAPCIMIPDHGNPDSRAYLRVLPKRDWASQFSDWLDIEHAREFPR